MDAGFPKARAKLNARPEVAPEVTTELDAFGAAVLCGLSQADKAIPSRFLYDARGSALFEEITELAEYYPTRTEIALLRRHGADIAAHVPDATALIEFGSGSSRKTKLLLQALQRVLLYVPIDIEASCLAQAEQRLKQSLPQLAVLPLVADFTAATALPAEAAAHPRLGFFSGSTIGNLTHSEARVFLANAGRLLGPGAAFLIGVDLKKPVDTLLPAYNDGRGITAEFNLNLLARINRELAGTFELARFAHRAVYDPGAGRIEMHLVSLAEQTVSVLGQRFSFAEGEHIHTENSYKYTAPEVRRLAAAAGWRHEAVWIDDAALFSLHLLRLA